MHRHTHAQTHARAHTDMHTHLHALVHMGILFRMHSPISLPRRLYGASVDDSLCGFETCCQDGGTEMTCTKLALREDRWDARPAGVE